MMFYIRADANSIIGSGHVMRCLAIAEAMKKKGVESTFITADREAEELITSYGYPIICLDSLWNQLDNETKKIIRLIEKLDIQAILIDSYYVTESYLQVIKEHAKVVYMDDLNKFIYPVDVLINYNVYASRENYYENYDLTKTTLLLGCEFVPLREEFQGIGANINEHVSDILITTGGSDPYNVASSILKFIINKKVYSTIRFHVVVGRFNENIDELEKLAKEYDNIILHRNVSKMSELMSDCDIAISAGGSTVYELCACGVPSISYTFADNQWEAIKELDRLGIIYYAGDVREDVDMCVASIESRIIQYISEPIFRWRLSQKMKSMVDGLGADRTAEQIYRFYKIGG